MTNLVGSPAPDFTLPSHLGDKVALASFRGERNVLVVFYPFAFTGVCSDELRDLQETVPLLGSAAVLAVSCDPLPSLQRFAADRGLAFPLLSDFWPHGAVSTAYTVFLPEKGFATRGSFLIDRAGTVRWSVVNPPGEARDPAAYLEALAELDC